VIGSACCPLGFVILHAEPVECKDPRSGVKMRMDNLWTGKKLDELPAVTVPSLAKAGRAPLAGLDAGRSR
jgi:hypothetical protein